MTRTRGGLSAAAVSEGTGVRDWPPRIAAWVQHRRGLGWGGHAASGVCELACGGCQEARSQWKDMVGG